MALSDFNDGMDCAYEGGYPNENKMANNRDYFEGYCHGESINYRFEQNAQYEKEMNAELERLHNAELERLHNEEIEKENSNK